MKNTGRTRKADQIIVALLQHGTLEKAAAVLGLSEVTLWRWLQKSEFQEAYRKARQEAFSQTAGRLQLGSNVAAGTLLRIMLDKEAPAASRVRAAQTVLEIGLRVMELENFGVRIQKIEKRLRDS